MTWTKLSDDYGDETWTLSDSAFRLLTECLIWSNRKLLDCRIPLDDVSRFGKRPEALDELLNGGWVRVDGDVLVVIFHAMFQRDRETQVAITKRNQENGAKGGRPPKPGRERAPQRRSESAAGNPDGIPDGNPRGQDRTGQDFLDGRSSQQRDEDDDWGPVPEHLRSAPKEPEPKPVRRSAISSSGPAPTKCSRCGRRVGAGVIVCGDCTAAARAAG